MAKFLQTLNESHMDFIKQQKIFFTATAPDIGRINLSPKGMDTFRILDPKTVAYLDLTGSGNETAAHISKNGRMTIMMCAFNGEPLILRLYGKGEVITPRSAQWPMLIPLFDTIPGTRQIIQLHIESTQSSCGFSVPVFEFIAEREQLAEWANKKGEKGLTEYRKKNNQTSIDGITIPFEYQ